MTTASYGGEVTIVVGPEKTATTFIQLLLEQHTDIILPQGIKETFFFDRFFDNGVDWYLTRFDLSESKKRLVEVAPSYFCEEDAIARIAEAFPQARIVLCARDLVDRTISHHNHLRRYGYTKSPLQENMNADFRPLRASRYAHYGPKWEAAFGPDRVAMLDMAVLKRDPALFARQVFEAVGVDVIEVSPEILSTRSNEAVQPGNFLVARCATLVSNKLKQWGMYRVLEMARNSSLRRLAFGSKKPEADTGVDQQLKADLRVLLADDYAYLSEHYGINYSDTSQEDARGS